MQHSKLKIQTEFTFFVVLNFCILHFELRVFAS